MGGFRGLSRLVSTDLGPHTLPQQSTDRLAANVSIIGGLEAHLANLQLPVPTTASSWSYVV
jgi:hypothetical protein